MRYSINLLFLIGVCVACFFGGWAAYSNYGPRRVETVAFVETEVFNVEDELCVIQVGFADGIETGMDVALYDDAIDPVSAIAHGVVVQVSESMSVVKVAPPVKPRPGFRVAIEVAYTPLNSPDRE